MARRLSHLLAGNDLQVADQDGLRPPEPRDIALLLRRRRNLFAYEDALRACGLSPSRWPAAEAFTNAKKSTI